MGFRCKWVAHRQAPDICVDALALLVMFLTLTVAAGGNDKHDPPPVTAVIVDRAHNISTWRAFDGIGGLSGGGATSTFLLAYQEPQRSDILDLLFKPRYGAGLNILKVEIGSDDQTTDGCEACHMRSSTEVDCNRGYEWGIMKEAVQRNPDIVLYGLPWGWAGWLGFGTNWPYTNVTATADYTAKWIECGRDVHGLNISMVGLWNEEPGPADYIVALRARLDQGNLHHVRIIAPDQGGGGMEQIAREMAANKSINDAVWGLGSHYPGAHGTSDFLRSTGLTMWSAEDYSTYSDATGAGCWGRLLIQNLGWDLTATISWYLLGGFARGMDYDSDGLVRAEWPTSGHYEITPMLWITMHWSKFTAPGWRVLPCPDIPTSRCALSGGGNYTVLISPSLKDISIIIHAFRHNTSKCIRNDPPDWTVVSTQETQFDLSSLKPIPASLHVWRSCSSWVYPGSNDSWFVKQDDIPVTPAGIAHMTVEVDCYYTLTTIQTGGKPAFQSPPPKSAAFPLPYSDSFDGTLAGGEAPFFGDQMGKWETVQAKGGRSGNVSEQQLDQSYYPVSNRGHSQPLTIIGDMFFRDVEISADILIDKENVGAGLALRVRNEYFFRGVTPGLYLYVLATPGIPTKSNPNDPGAGGPGGVPAYPAVPLKCQMNCSGSASYWKLCTNSFCEGQPLASGKLPSTWKLNEWHRLSLSVVGNTGLARMDGCVFYNGSASQPNQAIVTERSCKSDMVVLPSGRMMVGNDYAQVQLGSDPSDVERCVEACCADSKCQAWAVAVSAEPTNRNCTHGTACCWLKTARGPQSGSGEIAAGYKPVNSPTPPPSPKNPYNGELPPSGWAALVSTLGKVQFDNFGLRGLSKGGHAIVPCGNRQAVVGDPVVSVPCDVPSLLNTWTRGDGEAGTLQLALTQESPPLCLGMNDTSNLAVLVECDSPSLRTHIARTGQIVGRNGDCLDVEETKTGTPPWSQASLNNACSNSDSQQYQYNPQTGALRPKASTCTADFAGSINQYRDCCLSVCPSL